MIPFTLPTQRQCALWTAHIPHPSHWPCQASQCQGTQKGVGICHQVAVTTWFQADTGMLCHSATSAPCGVPRGFLEMALKFRSGCCTLELPSQFPCEASQWHSSGLIWNCREVWKAILSAATKANQTIAKQMITYSNFIVNKSSTHSLCGPLIQQYCSKTSKMHKTS